MGQSQTFRGFCFIHWEFVVERSQKPIFLCPLFLINVFYVLEAKEKFRLAG